MPPPSGDESGTEPRLTSSPPPNPAAYGDLNVTQRPSKRRLPGGMGLVHEMQVWAFTAVILSVWWATEWSWNGGSGAAASTSEAFRNYVANSMLVHDEYTQKGYDGPGFMKWMLELEAIPGDVHDAFMAVEEEGYSSDSLQLDLALVSLRFSQDKKDDTGEWKEIALEALESVSEKGRKEPTYHYVKGAVDGTPLTEGERNEFEQYLREQPVDWWKGFLAAQHQLPDLVDQEALQRAQQGAMGDIVFAAVILVDLTLLGLLAIPAAWMALSRPRLKQPASHRRLYRLWPGPRVVSTFALAALAALWLNHQVFALLYPWVAAMIGAMVDEYSAWQTNTWIWLGWATAMAALPLLPLCRTYAPGFSRLAEVFGFRNRDFASLSFFGLGVTSMGLLPWLFHFVDAGLASLGSTSSVLDGLSRSFSDQGELALPLGIFWSVIMAPFVEEIIFRGFIFRSVQARWGTLVGMLISSFVFAGSHFYSVNGTIHVFLYGLLFCWVYQRTGKLAASMFVHAGSNLAVTLLSHFSGG
ncbi:type II CAAX endopeptidase family protein [Verrucomicrobium sp. BvORR034]|uniref:CPBP family intramembrane glutamic endopeptidase n=1 Tax=Verrucomicrobium sp. BvORR034 TaxID=1396418 RepID=UPI0009DD55DC|nr:type II CAAX endopeptidase family protein [Verrucomicrobium sp. BvORR034]